MGEFIITDKAVQSKLSKGQYLTNEDLNSIENKEGLLKVLQEEKERSLSSITFNIS